MPASVSPMASDSDLLEADSAIVPDCRKSQVLAVIPSALERERHFDVSWWRLIQRKLWRDKLLGPQSAPKLPPHEDWLGPVKGPWPNGVGHVPAKGHQITLCWAFVHFLWRMKYKDAKKCMLFKLIIGIAAPATSLLQGLAVDEMTPGTSFGINRGERVLNIVLFAFAILLISLLSSRLQYEFEGNVPEASVREHLRQMLFRELQGGNGGGPPLISRTPGAAVALLDRSVQIAVDNIWANVFTFIQRMSTAICILVVAVVSVIRSDSSSERAVLTIIVGVFLVPIAMFFLTLVWMWLGRQAFQLARHGEYIFHVFHMSSEGCVFVFHLRPPEAGIHAEYPGIS